MNEIMQQGKSSAVKTRVLLVQAYLDRPQRFYTFPIGLATIAAFLREEWDVKGIDPNAYSNSLDRLKQFAKEFDPDVVGISLRNLDSCSYFDPHIYYNGFVKTVRLIRETLPNCRIIAGGSGFSLLPKRIMEDVPDIDFGVFLEGEETFPDLLRNISHPERVTGLYYRDGHGIQFTGVRPLVPFSDDDPLPALDIFELKPYMESEYAVGVETKRGCAYKCVYCCYYQLNGSRYRLKSPQRVIDEIKAIRAFGVYSISFTDSVFNTPIKHSIEILKGMRNELDGLKWTAYLSPAGLTDEFVSLCLETGMKTLVFSPDTVTDEALKAMGKGINMKTLDKAVGVIGRHPPAGMGINFFVNGPQYNYRTLWAFVLFTLRTKRKLGRRFSLLLPFLKMGYIRVEPGTPLEKIAKEDGGIDPNVDLLPKTAKDFDKVFYFNKNLWLFNMFFKWSKRFFLALAAALLHGGKR